MYKTENYHKPASWMKRLIFVSILFVLIAYIMIISNVTQITYWIIYTILYLFFVLSNQIEELTIDDERIILEQKSIFPFLTSKNEIGLSQIKTLNLKSNQSSNERGWYFFERQNKNMLELITNDDVIFIINGKLHLQGANGIKTLIDKTLKITL
jgi:hypothetical protein